MTTIHNNQHNANNRIGVRPTIITNRKNNKTYSTNTYYQAYFDVLDSELYDVPLEDGEIDEPDTWELHEDPIAMRPFYYCPKHDVSCYEHPSIHSGDDVRIITERPTTWTKQYNELGETCYHCAATDEMTWNAPRGHVEILRYYIGTEKLKSTGKYRETTSMLYPRLPMIASSMHSAELAIAGRMPPNL